MKVDIPKAKVNVEDDLSAKGVTPAANEEGANHREEMINNAFINLNKTKKIKIQKYLNFN